MRLSPTYTCTCTYVQGSPSETLVALCPTGRLVAFITSSYKAQFLFLEGKAKQIIALIFPRFMMKILITGGPLQDVRDSGELLRYQNSFQGLLDIPRDPDSPKPR